MNKSDSYRPRSRGGDPALLSMLATLPRRRVPPGFAVNTTRRFEAALAARERRRLVRLALAGYLLCSSILWVLILNTGGARDALVAAYKEAAVFVESVMAIWMNLPLFSAIFTVAVFMLLLFLSAIIGKMDQQTSRAK
jgi:hypothetical protein